MIHAAAPPQSPAIPTIFGLSFLHRFAALHGFPAEYAEMPPCCFHIYVWLVRALNPSSCFIQISYPNAVADGTSCTLICLHCTSAIAILNMCLETALSNIVLDAKHIWAERTCRIYITLFVNKLIFIYHFKYWLAVYILYRKIRPRRSAVTGILCRSSITGIHMIHIRVRHRRERIHNHQRRENSCRKALLPPLDLFYLHN